MARIIIYFILGSAILLAFTLSMFILIPIMLALAIGAFAVEIYYANSDIGE